ncbi:alpha/beta hydrolase family esterase [Gordonia sp. SL306]|uniref:alpha/beta hydrolase family esterase n=1 Tax=Gordonia sp. SL306 TaxID=2995145 RepID=UPI00226FE4FA|nr:PHB depolymerase family esterase [Gordonia sp. SL306]WAC55935.1 polyhydroxybutyrate depolymerase [Gordonia sp. SL306]
MHDNPRTRRRRRTFVWSVLVAVVTMVGAGAGWVPGVTGQASASPIDPRPAAGCPSLRAGDTITRSVTVRGVHRTYRIHVPADHTGRQRLPLVLAFHGRAERGATFERYTGLSSLPAITVYPDGLRGTDNRTAWQGAPYSSPRADDIAFTRAILGAVRTSACVDRNRTYAVGRSNGGGLVAMLACRMPREFTGFATISAAIYTRTLQGCSHGPPISLVDFHGTADGVIHYGGGTRFHARYLSTPAWLRTWSTRAGCADTTVTIPLNSVVDRVSWPFCAQSGHAIVHYRIRGGTHRWPGSMGNRVLGSSADTVSATQLLWQFFMTHPRYGSS